MDPTVAISHEVVDVGFSFVASDSIKKISVKSINNPQTFDPVTQQPTIGGLYDPSLGPADKSQMTRVYRYNARLKLLNAGMVFESMELENMDISAMGNSSKIKDDGAVFDAIDSFVEASYEKHGIKKNTMPELAHKVTLTNEYSRRITKEFLSIACSVRKCENCGGKSPTLRKESNSKIFEQPLSKRDKSQMNAKGMRVRKLFDDAGETNEHEYLSDNADEDSNKSSSVYLSSIQVKEHLRLLWDNEKPILDLLYGNLVKSKSGKLKKSSSCDQFFIDAVAVPPTKFRPISSLGDRQYDHAQNQYLAEIIKSNNLIVQLRAEATSERKLEADENATQLNENVIFQRTISTWVQLQESLNNLLDSTKNPRAKKMPPGIKQILEKKEGLFRKHMMGKRVNFAARSVISPDPMIETSEIGIPMVFAKKLTYPEPVTSFNLEQMRTAVINGPEKYPGAVSIVHEDGSLSMLAPLTKEQRIALANQLLTPSSEFSNREDAAYVNKRVNRHLKNGDMLLLNRQPTLHKPSIMGHIARVLPGEKTIRMHYANCNTYNADFDGDEMNVHFPQGPLAQAEARLIANTNNQYLVPTNGEPLRGLIQDHVVTGVLMTSRDTFFTKKQYTQLIYGALPETNQRVILTPPAIIKPQKLWTGKQLITTILKNLTRGRKQLNLESKPQVPGKSWTIGQKKDTEEGKVLVVDGELLTGVLDKKQFGAKPFGLVHSCFEVYDPEVAGKLLTALGRLFTNYVQMMGFTCRMDDLVVQQNADQSRKYMIKRALSQGRQILEEFAFGDDGTEKSIDTPLERQIKASLNNPKTSELDRRRAERTLNAIEEKKLFKALEETIRSDEKQAQLDAKMKTKTGSVTSNIVKNLIPNGLYKPFPDNGMQLMTVSGAKGSNVNVTQISCMLGQQELEGRRVPVMVSGKTLPSFRAYDLGPRAGGYITGRFLTGIKPQEYFFHCMAGREGLVDTAVKTARSGYLQRCLIKHLEGLKVNYDGSVRDCNDGSIYQFLYGEDSLDVTKSSYLKQFKFNAQNYDAFVDKYNPKAASQVLNVKKAEKLMRKAAKNPKKYDPVISRYQPAKYLGATSEKFHKDLRKYSQENRDNVLQPSSTELSPDNSLLPESGAYEVLMRLKYLHSLVEPGESVGLLAAQSIGEPSTQMTLNTFHFAGHGAKNVTLGIPRLREIVMTASRKPKTPQMRAPFLPHIRRDQAEKITRKMSKITLDLLMDGASVTETVMQKSGVGRVRRYTILLNFAGKAHFEDKFGLSINQVQNSIEKKFIKKLLSSITKRMKSSGDSSGNDVHDELENIGEGVDVGKFNESSITVSLESESTLESKKKNGKKSGAKSVLDEDDDGDFMDIDATASARASKKKQHSSYDGPDDDEKQMMNDSDDSSSDDDENTSSHKNSSGSFKAAGEMEREERIVSDNDLVTKYDFDAKEGKWCEISIEFPSDQEKILMIGLVEKVAPTSIVSEIPGISKCFVTDDHMEDGSKQLFMVTDGVNISGLWNYYDYLDMNKIQSNDISAILDVYGVEAARQTIISEIKAVFSVYGIEVDMRHLFLIAEYMCFEGGYRAFSRQGIETSVSGFGKMSFETTMKFLTESALISDVDTLGGPSARLVLGKVVDGGTGSFELMQRV